MAKNFFSVPTSLECLSAPTSVDLRSVRCSCIARDSDCARNEGTSLCSPRGRSPLTAAPAEPAPAKHLRGAILLPDNTRPRPRLRSPKALLYWLRPILGAGTEAQTSSSHPDESAPGSARMPFQPALRTLRLCGCH